MPPSYSQSHVRKPFFCLRIGDSRNSNSKSSIRNRKSVNAIGIEIILNLNIKKHFPIPRVLRRLDIAVGYAVNLTQGMMIKIIERRQTVKKMQINKKGKCGFRRIVAILTLCSICLR